jgi:predicted transcriptional regulator
VVKNMATITIRIDENEKEIIQKYAKEHDLTVSWVIRKALKEFLAKEEKN